MKTKLLSAVLSIGLVSSKLLVAQDSKPEEILTVGSKAPAIVAEHWLTKGDGQFNADAEFQTGKVYVIAFWGTQSPGSIQNFVAFAQLQKQLAAHGVQVIVLSEEPLDVVERFLEQTLPVKEGEPPTLKQIASSVNLATDPDRSVVETYMEASGQFTLPTVFIVGKDGAIDWLGPAAGVSGPLGEVLQDIWDRRSAKAVSLQSQRRSMVLSKVNREMKDGDTVAALAELDKGLKAFERDAEATAQLQAVRVRVEMFPATKLAEEGKYPEAIELMDDLAVKYPKHIGEISQIKLSILLNGELYDQAVPLIDLMIAKLPNPIALNQIAWRIYEQSKDDDKYPATLLASAAAAAKKALELAPREAGIMDTCAHLLHRSGDLDAAIEMQTKASLFVDEKTNPGVKPYLEQLKQEKEAASK